MCVTLEKIEHVHRVCRYKMCTHPPPRTNGKSRTRGLICLLARSQKLGTWCLDSKLDAGALRSNLIVIWKFALPIFVPMRKLMATPQGLWKCVLFWLAFIFPETKSMQKTLSKIQGSIFKGIMMKFQDFSRVIEAQELSLKYPIFPDCKLCFIQLYQLG